MKEQFLAYLWHFRLFEQNNLKTTEGESLNILSPGTENRESGPDFFNAKIRIGQTVWAGNVEIHIVASDWYRHGHQNDAAYDNVILHLVYEADQSIRRKDGTKIPTLSLKKRLPRGIYQRYLQLLSARHQIPCAGQFQQVEPVILTNWMQRLAVERLEHKTLPVYRHLARNRNNWEATTYAFLCRAWGMKVNAEAFALLAEVLPLNILRKHGTDRLQTEALLFGQAGFLQQQQLFEEDYPKTLQKEYRYLQKKYNLEPLQTHIWKFGGLRPANFPTIRLAQLAGLLQRYEGTLFSLLKGIKTIEEAEDMFAVSTSAYWLNHYRFGKISKVNKPKKLGTSFTHHLIINALMPVLFVYGKQTGKPLYQERVLDLLEQLPAENNNVITYWKKLGVKPQSGFDTQALLQLKNAYCNQKKCLNCAVGNYLLSKA